MFNFLLPDRHQMYNKGTPLTQLTHIHTATHKQIITLPHFIAYKPLAVYQDK